MILVFNAPIHKWVCVGYNIGFDRISPSSYPSEAETRLKWGHMSKENIYLSGGLPKLYLITAAPIIVVMLVQGFYTLVDTYFLGEYVGADALTAVTLMFPIFMMLVALSAWVSSGFSSLFARLLGAKAIDEAGQAFVGAILLSLIISLVLIVGFTFFGRPLSLWIANGSDSLAAMGYTYISILIFTSPLMFILSVNYDALRCEGRMPVLAAITLTSSILNIVYNYLFIVKIEWGVAGSAIGTVCAQLSAFALILIYRRLRGANFQMRWHGFAAARRYWGQFLALGATTSLANFGVSLIATATLFSIQKWGSDYEVTAGAYGIITRLNTFAFLPLLGISIGMQTIVGNNYGAKLFERSNKALKIALGVAFIYNVTFQVLFNVFKDEIGFMFVDDAAIAAEIAKIIPFITAFMFLFGFNLMFSTYFQAIGDAVRALILGMSRTVFFATPLVLIIPHFLGEAGIWYAAPTSELLLLCLVMSVLYQRYRKTGYKFGVFERPTAAS